MADKNNKIGVKKVQLCLPKLKLGSCYNSFDEVRHTIDTYETENHVKLYRRDSRTILSSKSRAPKKYFSPKLKYKDLTFNCTRGGRPHKSQSNGIRQASSFKQGCEMHIRFGVSEDGSQLVVKSMSEEHNHEINEETIVKEALHPELCSYISKLVWSDINISIEDVKKQLEHYVMEEMFKDQLPPPRTRRQYFPSKKQIRYFMVKAKASLNISTETEQKLSAQAERLKEAHSDEKMVFNFKVKHIINPVDLSGVHDDSMGDGGEEDLLKNELQIDTQVNSQENIQDNAKVLFCHQTPHQQRILKRYSSQVILIQINDIYSKIPFPLFCLYVQTNVDYQLVGEFILQNNSAEMIIEGLQMIKEWNPGWSPKFVTVDYSEEQIAAVETAFSSAFLLISDSSREQAWHDWLSQEESEVSEHKDTVLKYLQAIANSYSEDTLNAAARELEESDVWKMSDKMRNWFQLHWLSQAKRWVAGYRPDDYLLTGHTNRTIEDELKIYKSIKLVNKATPLQDVIHQIVEHVVPVNKKQYELLNQESFKLQNELYYLYSDLPNYLSCRPGKLTYHIYERIKSAAEQSYIISFLHPGIFSVQGNNDDDDLLHTVSFGDSNSFPSCDCQDWQQYKLPCAHLCAVFSNYPGWTWDMLNSSYKNSSLYTIDWGAVPYDNAREIPGFRSDSSTQTTGATLLLGPGPTDIGKYNRMSHEARITETPQVLATQCRSLLQQISKLQLAHHSKENLYRLKSDLKELLNVFSNAPKVKHYLSSPGLSGSYVIQNRGGKRKGNISLNSPQTIFEQYNIKTITSKQVNVPKSNVNVNSIPVSSYVIKVDEVTTPTKSIAEENVNRSVLVVDPGQVLLSSAKKVSKEIDVTAGTKRPALDDLSGLVTEEKRLKENVSEDNMTGTTEPSSELKNVALEFDDDESDMMKVATQDSTVTAVIDDETINIPLDQVSVAISESLVTSTENPISDTTFEKPTFSTDSQDIITSSTVVYQETLNEDVNVEQASGEAIVEESVVK